MKEKVSFYNFMLGIILRREQAQQYHKTSTPVNYRRALESFMKFRNGKDISIKKIDSELMIEYESWLKMKGVCKNTSSFYMRILRAVYNSAVDKGFTNDNKPFKKVYTGVAKTVKRAVDLDTIRKIKELDLSNKPKMEFARDMFMFSFYTRGMALVDMANLKKSDLKNGILTYSRRKTGGRLSVKWESPMAEIADRYTVSGSEYLLPLTGKSGDYKGKQLAVNDGLHGIGEMLGLPAPLTLYTARHSWASIAYQKSIPISIISAGMGHKTEEITRVYLSTLDTSAVDEANNLIINDL